MATIKPLTSKELYLSGFYGNKIINGLNKKCFEKSINDQSIKYIFDGYEIYLKNNTLEFSGFWDKKVEEKILKAINTYIINIINSIENPRLKQRTLAISNSELSRKSKYHILNIELLVKAAKNKPDYFNLLYYLMSENDFYEATENNYEYFMFAIFDAESKDLAVEIYDLIANEIFPDDDKKYYQLGKIVSLDKAKEQIERMLDTNLLQKINDNIKLTKIIDKNC